jgi:hypothetical protein
MAASEPSIGSVKPISFTTGEPRRRVIFAPNARSSYRSVMRVAPSTAVSPAIATTESSSAS